MRSVVHEFLKWLPPALFGGTIAVAAGWPSAHDWVGATVASVWGAMMGNGVLAASVLILLALYVAAIIWTHEASSPPKLSGQIDQVVINQHSDGRLWVWLNVVVRNSGAPSVAEGWQVFLSPKGGTPLKFDNFALADQMVLGMESGGAVSLRRDRDALYDKCIIPIPQGGLVRGWLHALSPGPLQLADPSTAVRSFVVKFRDISGKWHQAVPMNFAGGDGGGRYYPDGTGGERMTREQFERWLAENPGAVT